MTWLEPGGYLDWMMRSQSGESPWKVAVCDAQNFNYPYIMLEDASYSP